ncbi:hypothetical protein Pan241w_14890 [Gimesia alba]|uniref:Uncharacterized protein n=1 Tax=Gimesia alba TaxID=2527973 RepID=A0A517RC17_9PLAN|nr:hypothetical protein [Gimesia alba]QDT41428.1 hypothetical protein Pan241w_14890 [Gimesia alba]
MPDKKESKFIRFLCLAVPILLAIYVMSIGPVYVSYEDATGQEAVAFYHFYQNFYAPLLWCAERSDFDDLYMQQHTRTLFKGR